MDVILLHGLGRFPLSMMLLARRLRQAGHRTHFFGYLPSLETFSGITDRLIRRLRRFVHRPYAAVGHSLGGLILRSAIAQLPASSLRPCHLFMLGTPNLSPRLARYFRFWLPYRLLTGDSGQLLADPARMKAIPIPVVPMTLVAGTVGWRGRRSPFGQEPNDHIVAVAEALLEEAAIVELPLRHTFMMNSPAVAAMIRESLLKTLAL